MDDDLDEKPHTMAGVEEEALTEQLEDSAEQLRHEAQAKLEEAKEKLQEAKRDLESSITADSAPRRIPFGRTRASLKLMASELQSAPMPVLSRSSSHQEAPSVNDEGEGD